MIWNNLYLCFLLVPIGSDMERSIIWTINHGNEEQATDLLARVECNP